MQGAYTWSHSFDDVTSYRGALPQDSFNFKGDYGNSDFDNRHTFVGLVTYDVPGAHLLPAVTRGWQLGAPADLPQWTADHCIEFNRHERHRRIYAAGRPGRRSIRGLSQSRCEQAMAKSSGVCRRGSRHIWSSRRNAYYAPGYNDVDFSVFKNTKIGERINTQFRVEMFNLFNTTNYAPPFSYNGFDNPNTAQNGSFQLTDTIGDFNGAPGIGAGEPFNTQLALKITF